MLIRILISTLALSLIGCAAVPAPPATGPNIERISPEELARMLPAPNPKLPLAEIVRLAKLGASAKDIIARIRETGSRYELNASQTIDLHAQGVDKEVLDYMQSAREQALRDRIADEINQRELRHADQLRREQELRLDNLYCDPWRPGYPGFGWSQDYLFRPYGNIYWRR